MIIDYRDNAFPDDVEADLCIIGAGAAGLSIARTFIGTSVNVRVIESGGMSGEEQNQALYDGSSIGSPDFDPGISRMRVFGGSCNLWGGGCIPLGDLGRYDDALQLLVRLKESPRLLWNPVIRDSYCFQQYADEPAYLDILRDQEARKAAWRERLAATLAEFGIKL